MKPENLPYGWDYQEATDSVVCGGCCFRFGAEHPNHDDAWTCPSCGDGTEWQECETRLAQLFAKCEANPDGAHHAWNFNTKKCAHCEAPWPYPEHTP